jgi:rhodanese-related sulfurtransferase
MPPIAQVRPSQLATWLEAAKTQGTPLLLDVREPNEVAVASVAANGFEVLLMPMRSVPTRLIELDPNQPIACLCHHGARSQNVASFLANQGFVNVVNIAGGIDAWSLELDAGIARY